MINIHVLKIPNHVILTNYSLGKVHFPTTMGTYWCYYVNYSDMCRSFLVIEMYCNFFTMNDVHDILVCSVPSLDEGGTTFSHTMCRI